MHSMPQGEGACPLSHLSFPCSLSGLQWQAFNEATFRIPDAEGWQPQQQPISPDWPLGTRLVTRLPVPSILGEWAGCGFGAPFLL